MTDYRKEFPDFDPATLPAIPSTWVDTSWHNDACPSFRTMTGYTVFIDFSDPAVCEWPEGERFTVHADPEIHDHNESLFATDTWQEVLAFLANPEQAMLATYDAWKRANGLPGAPCPPSALTRAQTDWLADFWRRWGIVLECVKTIRAHALAAKRRPKPSTDRLAHRFAARIRHEFHGPKLAEIRRRNREEYGPGVCATHDFCDANIVMADAFADVYGRLVDIDSDADLKLWGEAWDKAITRYLS